MGVGAAEEGIEGEGETAGPIERPLKTSLEKRTSTLENKDGFPSRPSGIQTAIEHV